MNDAGAPPDKSDSAGQVSLGLGSQGEPAKPYRVLARKYRPSSFDDLIGQEAMSRTTEQSLEFQSYGQGRLP